MATSGNGHEVCIGLIPYVTSDGREDMTSRGSRVVRGGSHGDLDERTLRAGFRADQEADSRSDAVGFRVVPHSSLALSRYSSSLLFVQLLCCVVDFDAVRGLRVTPKR